MKKLTAFSPEGFLADSSLYKGQIVEHNTSWLTINPILGCSLNCAYCFRERWEASDKPFTAVESDKAIQALISHPLFEPNETPLSINISSTDALLPKVKEVTFYCLKKLDDLGYKNIVGITSKMGLKDSDIKFINSLSNIRIIFFISYAEVPIDIEPVPIKPRINNLKLLKKNNIPCVLYFRPIVKGWNDSIEKIEKVLKVGNSYANAIAIGGLRVSSEIIDAMKKRNVSIPDNSGSFYEKEVSKEIEDKIQEVYQRLNLSVPIYKHTSCAVSYIHRIPNYNCLYENPTKNCVQTCPQSQQDICGSKFYL